VQLLGSFGGTQQREHPADYFSNSPRLRPEVFALSPLRTQRFRNHEADSREQVLAGDDHVHVGPSIGNAKGSIFLRVLAERHEEVMGA
jgi:hypothetical protein